MKRRKPYKRPSKIREIIILHVRNNFNSYLIACIIFLVSVALGVVFINNISDMQTQDLKDYLLTKLKSVQTNEATYLKDLIIENSLLIICRVEGAVSSMSPFKAIKVYKSKIFLVKFVIFISTPMFDANCGCFCIIFTICVKSLLELILYFVIRLSRIVSNAIFFQVERSGKSKLIF